MYIKEIPKTTHDKHYTKSSKSADQTSLCLWVNAIQELVLPHHCLEVVYFPSMSVEVSN